MERLCLIHLLPVGRVLEIQLPYRLPVGSEFPVQVLLWVHLHHMQEYTELDRERV